MTTGLSPLPPTYQPEDLGVFGPGSTGYQEPTQGIGDRIALALATGGIPEPPSTLRPGEGQGPGGLAALLSGAARGFAGTRGRVISEREKMNQALGQLQHERNVAGIEATKEARKARIVTPEMLKLYDLPPEYLGKQVGELPAELTTKPPSAKPQDRGKISLSEIYALPYDPKTGRGLKADDLGKDPGDADVQKRISGMTPVAPLSPALAGVDVPTLVEGVISGRIDPRQIKITARGGVGAKVATGLLQRGYDINKASLAMDALATLSHNAQGPQVLALRRAALSVNNATSLMEDLNKQLTEAVKSAPIPRSEIPESNRIVLALALRGKYGPKALDIARQFDTQARVVRNEYPTVLSGGWAPQQAQIEDASKMIDPLYGEGGMASSLKTLRQDAIYKTNAVTSLGAIVPGMGEVSLPWQNQGNYFQPQPMFPMGAPAPAPAPAPAAAPVAAPAAPALPGVRVRARSGGQDYVKEIPAAEVDAWLARHKAWSRITDVTGHTRAVR